MGQPVNGDGEHARVAENDLAELSRRRITGNGRLHVERQKLPNVRDLSQHLLGVGLGQSAAMAALRPAALALMANASVNLLGEHQVQCVQPVADVVSHVVEAIGLLAEVPGIEDLSRRFDDSHDNVALRQHRHVEMIDLRQRLARIDNSLDDPGQYVVPLLAAGGRFQQLGPNLAAAGFTHQRRPLKACFPVALSLCFACGLLADFLAGHG